MSQFMKWVNYTKSQPKLDKEKSVDIKETLKWNVTVLRARLHGHAVVWMLKMIESDEWISLALATGHIVQRSGPINEDDKK